MFLEHEVNPSIARNPRAQSKKELRESLLETRIEACANALLNEALAHRLDGLLERLQPRCVGFYWPLRGEFDARALIGAWLAAGHGAHARRAALPVVAERHTPLDFHAWTPAAPMRAGHHNIPVPEGGEPVVPDLLLIPCVGFDAEGFRLGYGGGYYDRTLAAWPGAQRPVTIGVAFEACRLDALPRDAHDLALDVIVTEAAFHPADADVLATTS